MPTPADTEALRQLQEDIRSLIIRDLEGFFASLDPDRPEAARDALLEYVPFLVSTYGEQAASLAADWYDDVRASESVGGRFRAAMTVPDESEAAQGLVRRAAGALFTDAPLAALPMIQGKAAQYAIEGARQTVMASTMRDPRSSGWQRVTREGACRFCRMLAGRGAVYKESTAFFAAHGGAEGGECNCAAVPSWDPDAPEVDVFLYEASRRTTGLTEPEKARHNEVIRRAMDEYVPE
jgi:hypothetical protein